MRIRVESAASFIIRKEDFMSRRRNRSNASGKGSEGPKASRGYDEEIRDGMDEARGGNPYGVQRTDWQFFPAEGNGEAETRDLTASCKS